MLNRFAFLKDTHCNFQAVPKSLIRIKDSKAAAMSEWAITNCGGAMNTITDYLTKDHKHCDKFFIEAETCASTGLWERAEACFQQFCDALKRHFAKEEKVLFLAFENAIGSSNGPTGVMRNEHQQIHGIVSMLQDALRRRDQDAFLGHSETLNIMMQQHNLKEESILYLMTDRVLSAQKSEIITSMSDIGATIGPV